MDWLLVTNPSSKNILISSYLKKFPLRWRIRISKNTRSAIRQRYDGAIKFGLVHIAGAIFMSAYLPVTPLFILINILGNVYPVIVQLYVGIRCYQILSVKKECMAPEELKL